MEQPGFKSNTRVGKKSSRLPIQVGQAFCGAPATFLSTSVIVISISCLLIVASRATTSSATSSDGNSKIIVDHHASTSEQQQQQQANEQKSALENELNSIIQQHGTADNNRLLAEAIISRLMVDNLTGSNLVSGGNNDIVENEIGLVGGEPNELLEEAAVVGGDGHSALADQAAAYAGPTGPEAMRWRKILNLIQNYEDSLGGSTGGRAFNPFPTLPSSEAATMKRAAVRMGNLALAPSRLNFGRGNFDFGLGKRPDSTGSAGGILRFGDSPIGYNGQAQPVSQFGKRPSAHRYDFGLGKRVASPAYPRYDFGLGKRAPNRLRYDFGLGK